jgi:hypothetical protein
MATATLLFYVQSVLIVIVLVSSGLFWNEIINKNIFSTMFLDQGNDETRDVAYFSPRPFVQYGGRGR